MVSQELSDELHAQLIAERQRLEQEIANLGGVKADTFLVDETDAVDQHPADEGSELFEREKNMTVQRTLEASLQSVNDALRKFDEGTYGICEVCGKPIAEKRLRALPEATHCIEDQSKIDRMANAAQTSR
jgi:DnaK suppressor protein